MHMAFQNSGWPCKQELKAAGKVGSKVSSSERNSFCCGQDSKSCLSGLCKQEVINVIEIHSVKTGECALTSPAAQAPPAATSFSTSMSPSHRLRMGSPAQLSVSTKLKLV